MTYNLGPLQINPSTNEPFVRLRKHPNIIITPPRRTDSPSIVPIMNDEKVHIWLRRAPYPYYEEHAIEYIETIKSKCDRGLEELRNATGGQVEIVLSQCPVRSLREVQEDGSEIFLGDIGFSRSEDEFLLKGSKVDKKMNLELPAGHPDIVWTIGYFLASSHHGKGIMSDAVDTIIDQIGRPYLGVNHIVGATYLGNEGSMKVFSKNGFTFRCQLMDAFEAKGKLRSLNVLERHFDRVAKT